MGIPASGLCTICYRDSEKIGTFPEKKFWSFFSNIKYPDLYGLVLVLCAIGLIFIPEIVYVRDIYEKTAPKSQHHVQTHLSGIHHVWDYDGIYIGFIYSKQDKKM